MGNEVCAVVVSFNSAEGVSSCINSLSNQVDRILVIDNGSGPETKNKLKAICTNETVCCLFNGENRGLAAALNQGLQCSLQEKFRWTLLLDQDSILSEQMVESMLRSYENLAQQVKKEVAIIVPVVFDRNFRRILHPVITTNFLNKKVINPDSDLFVHLHITSGSLLKNAVLTKIGFMNEYFFIDYVDYEYCFRVLERGYKILLSKDTLLSHSLAEHKQKIGIHFREHKADRVYYQMRNRLFTALKYRKRHRSFFYAESCRSVGKLIKIVLLESDKKEKLKMYFKGIRDALLEYDKLDHRY